MAKNERHDLREYSLCTGPLTTSDSGTIGFMPIPAAGRIIKIAAGLNTLSDGDQDITFELAGTTLKAVGGATATMALLNADVMGTVHVVEFDVNDEDNFAMGAEDGDLLAAGVNLEIISDGNGATGSYTFVVTIGP